MKLSGYTTVYNCINNEYPWEDSIKSLLGFCDEVCIVDGGSDDGTWEKLQKWKDIEPKLVINQYIIDRNRPDFAYESDGRQKTRARKLCSGDMCWQMDVDEIIVQEDYEKTRNICLEIYNNPQIELMTFPLIEYWGSNGKVRIDVNPWKWRLSRNNPNIIHGIPGDLLKLREDNTEYALQGTDSCDYIYEDTKIRVPFVLFCDINKVNNIRAHASAGNQQALEFYENWTKSMISQMPTIRHYSWYDIERKIKNYKTHWSKFWCSMYNKSIDDTKENNMMFDKPWSEVSDIDIKELALRLENEMGGWIFHQKIDWNRKTKWIEL